MPSRRGKRARAIPLRFLRAGNQRGLEPIRNAATHQGNLLPASASRLTAVQNCLPMKPTPPARLHVILAREAPLALVIRRGPAKQVCTILWNRRTDEFTLGQWLKGRIYEDRCDLSPDGRYFIYFAFGGRPQRQYKAWTAVSRAPWLKAIALYSKGST